MAGATRRTAMGSSADGALDSGLTLQWLRDLRQDTEFSRPGLDVCKRRGHVPGPREGGPGSASRGGGPSSSVGVVPKVPEA